MSCVSSRVLSTFSPGVLGSMNAKSRDGEGEVNEGGSEVGRMKVNEVIE